MHKSARTLSTMAVTLLAATLPAAPAISAGHGAAPISSPHMMHAAGGADAPLMKTAIGGPGKTSDAVHTIKVDLQSFAFQPGSITVKPGETVRFVLVNDSDISHEFNIGTARMHQEHRKEMLEMMPSGAMPADGSMSGTADHRMTMHKDPNVIQVPPGQTKEFLWRFPKDGPALGALMFACDLPGHSEAGMVGSFMFQMN